MAITKDMLHTLRGEIEAALAASGVVQRFGLQSLKLGNCTYDQGGSFVFKLEGVTADGLDKDAQRYDELRQWQVKELPPRGHVFDNRGVPFTIIGCNSTGSKIKATNPAGVPYLFDRGRLLVVLKAQEKRK